MGTVSLEYGRDFEVDLINVLKHFSPDSLTLRNHEIYDYMKVAVMTGPRIPNYGSDAQLIVNQTQNIQDTGELTSVSFTYTIQKKDVTNGF